MVGIPAFNESATISVVVEDSKNHSDEVFVVDDGSTDDTAALAARAGASVHVHQENKGKGAAIKKIFEVARERDVERLVTIDGDGQHDTGEIPDLIDYSRDERANVVVGSRYLSGSNETTPIHRRFCQRLYDMTTYVRTGYSVTDSSSGFRAFDRTAIEEIEVSDVIDPQIKILCEASDNELTVSEVPISVIYDIPNPHSSSFIADGLRRSHTAGYILYQRNVLLPVLFTLLYPLFLLVLFSLVLYDWDT